MNKKSKPQQVVTNYSKIQFIVFFVLSFAVVLSAIAVIYIAHNNRNLINELQSLKHEADAHQVEWGQLLLEQRTWAAHSRIEKIVAENLEMKVPTMNEIIMVKP